MAVQIQLRRDTTANWTSANPILASAEIGVETDTGKFKMGDGSTVWNSLAYASGGSGDVFQSTTGDGATVIDWGLGNLMFFTFGAQNETPTFIPPPDAKRVFMWLKQDGIGGRTVIWPSTVRWPGGVAPTLTTAPNSVDIVALAWDGNDYYGGCNLNFI